MKKRYITPSTISYITIESSPLALSVIDNGAADESTALSKRTLNMIYFDDLNEDDEE